MCKFEIPKKVFITHPNNDTVSNTNIPGPAERPVQVQGESVLHHAASKGAGVKESRS